MSMGDTLTWEGNVPVFRAGRSLVSRLHPLTYKVRFIVGFSTSSDERETMTIHVAGTWTAEDVAKEMLREWKRKRRPFPMKRIGTKLKFTIPNNAVAVHAFKSRRNPNGRVVPPYPLKLEVLSGLDVSVDLID